MGGVALSSFAGPDAVADMASLSKQSVVEVMADVHGAQQPVPLLIQEEKHAVRHQAACLGLGFEVTEVILKIVIIVFEYDPRRVVRMVDFLVMLPLVDHFAQLCPVSFRELYQFKTHAASL